MMKHVGDFYESETSCCTCLNIQIKNVSLQLFFMFLCIKPVLLKFWIATKLFPCETEKIYDIEVLVKI